MSGNPYFRLGVGHEFAVIFEIKRKQFRNQIDQRERRAGMNTFVIEGGHPLNGEVRISGNKNAALPMLAATLLTDETVHLENLPLVRDVFTLRKILEGVGSQIREEGETKWAFDAKTIESTAPNTDLCRAMRASFALAGPILAREGAVTLPSPGGDRIGRRPLDTHIRAFEALGAEVEIEPGNYRLTSPRRLQGADIFLEEMSVLATENVIMAASLASGTTVIRNAASEPHVQDLCNMINAMGGSIQGIGTNTIIIEGREKLSGGTFQVGPDYIEAGSFIALAALSKGEFTIHDVRPQELTMTRIAFGRMGLTWEDRDTSIFVPGNQTLEMQDGLHGAMARIHDAPWPGFPADLTSIAIVLATGAKGSIQIHEWMYESRLYWVDRLISMGARIVVCDPHRAIVEGPAQLYGQQMSSPDIRAGMALLIAALVAKGESQIQNAQQIDRGYMKIEERLRALGAKIRRV